MLVGDGWWFQISFVLFLFYCTWCIIPSSESNWLLVGWVESWNHHFHPLSIFCSVWSWLFAGRILHRRVSLTCCSNSIDQSSCRTAPSCNRCRHVWNVLECLEGLGMFWIHVVHTWIWGINPRTDSALLHWTCADFTVIKSNEHKIHKSNLICLGFFRQGDALNQLLFADELPEETLQVAHLGQPAACRWKHTAVGSGWCYPLVMSK